MTSNPADVQDIVERLRSEKQWNYEGPQTKFFAGKDIEYAYGLEACLDEGQYDGAKNVRDLIGMVKWNALGLIQSADEIERLRAALLEARETIHDVLHANNGPITDQYIMGETLNRLNVLLNRNG